MVVLFSTLALLGCGPDRQISADADRVQVRDGGPAIQAWFAPDDDVLGVELAAIDRVIAARVADPDPSAEYAIRYAVYNLRNPNILARLIQARNVGVAVQVLIDADQLDPARTWNQGDEILREAGFTFAPDHRDLGPDDAAELVGIDGSGLMHLKARLYTTPQGTELLTGSLNPGDNALFNDETLHLVRDPVIVDAYATAVDQVLADADFDNVWNPGSRVNVLFGPHASGPNAATQLMDWIAEESEQVLIASYSLRDLTAPGYDRSLVDLLGDKVAHGVPVVVITDLGQSDAWGDPTEDRLRERGVHVYEATNLTNEFTSMHTKFVVLGRTRIRVVTDTANLTSSGLGNDRYRARNIESTLFFDDGLEGGRVGRRYLAQTMRILERYAWQSEDGDAPYDALEAALFAHPGWPTTEVVFAAEAHTAWGESVYATGDRPELGRWGADHWGVPLTTTEATYPAWSAAPVVVPLGAHITYKHVAVQGAEVRWESGADRTFSAVPDPGLDTRTVDAVWRP